MFKFDEFQRSLLQLADDKHFPRLKELLESII